MKAVVVYDSQLGNTERLARAIAEQLGAEEPAAVARPAARSGRGRGGMARGLRDVIS
jgi:flavodoxin